VALLLPSTPLYPVAYMAAARLGAVTTGINVRYRRTEIGHVLRQSGAKCLLGATAWHDADFRGTVDALKPELPELATTEWLTPDEIRASTRAIVDRLGGTPRRPTSPRPTIPSRSSSRAARRARRRARGTRTGTCSALAEIENRRHAGGAPRRTKHLAAGLSFAHVGSMARIAIQIGGQGSSIIQDAFDTAVMLETIERERLEHLGCFPTQAIMLLDHPDGRAGT
jgi:acyl-CoA synthetase (AMP-forming)/AMP-acid ligase II